LNTAQSINDIRAKSRSLSPDPLARVRQRTWWQPLKTKKARRPEATGRKFQSKIFLDALDREKRCQISAGFDCCNHPEGTGLGEGGNARVVIAQLLAQDLPRVLAKQRRRDGVNDRR
jgi:hypothetical protein